MFEVLIREAGARFGLGDKSLQLVQMLLSFMTDKETGGLGGFLEKFKQADLGPVIQSWLGGGPSAQAISNTQLEKVLGASDGLIPALTNALGVGRESVTGALGYLIPALVGKLTPGGNLPSALPPEVSALASAGTQLLSQPGLGHAAGHLATEGKGMARWLPWIIIAALILLALAYCSQSAIKKEPAATPPAATSGSAATPKPAAAPSAPPAPTPAPVAPAPAVTAPATPAASDSAAAGVQAPAGAAVVAREVGGKPAVNVYFDSGKTDVAAEFDAKSAALLGYLKDHSAAQVVISGYSDATGDAAQNEALSKQRALAVQAALVREGIDEARTILEKPIVATGTTATDAASRRVEVVVRD